MRRTLLIMLACAFALMVAPQVAPARALALDGSYSIDELSTQLIVETNATAHIVERQTLTFTDRNAGVTWYLHVPESGESVRISNVRIAPVDDGGTLLGDWTRLQMIDSDPSAQGRQPGDTVAPSLRTTKTQPWYSYNIGDGMMRCYFPTGSAATVEAAAKAGDEDASADEHASDFHTYVIETDYTIAHRVRVYRDIGELYWRYVHDSLPADSQNVTLQIVLPVPGDADPVAASQEVSAWGHGPADGTFSVGEDGTVTYRIDAIEKGNYAEAHVVFPAGWEYDIAPNSANQFSELRRASAEAEESEWVDIGKREAAWDNKVRVLFITFALAIILVTAINAIRNGRSPRSRRTFVRAAATFAITALGVQLFFRESLTTAVLTALAVVCALASLAMPAGEITTEPVEVDEDDAADTTEAAGTEEPR